MKGRTVWLVAGALLVVVGVVWILQGFDVLGQDGGMNGEAVWAVIGSLVAGGGVYLLFTSSRPRGR